MDGCDKKLIQGVLDMMYLTKEEFRVEIARKLQDKMRGLMMRPNLDHALVLELGYETRKGASIHSLFVKFAFDAIFLNSGLEVVDMATIKPWTVNFTPRAAARYVVEVPEYTIMKNLISIGDRIEIDELRPFEEVTPEKLKLYEKSFFGIRKVSDEDMGGRPWALDERRAIQMAREREMYSKRKLTRTNPKASGKGNKKKAKK